MVVSPSMGGRRRGRVLLVAIASLACLAALAASSTAAVRTAGMVVAPSCDSTIPTGYSTAELKAAVHSSNCWLGGITIGEKDLPRSAKGQATACLKVQATGQALAWQAIEQLDNIDVETVSTIDLVNYPLEQFANYFGKAFDVTASIHLQHAARIDAYDDEKMLADVLRANGSARDGKYTDLPNGVGVSGDVGLTYNLAVEGQLLSSHDCTGAQDAADKVAKNFNKANAAAMKFMSTATPT